MIVQSTFYFWLDPTLQAYPRAYEPKFLLTDEGKPSSSSKFHDRYHEHAAALHFTLGFE